MENENDLDYGIYGQRPNITPIGDMLERLGEIGRTGRSGVDGDPDFDSIYNKDIVIPPTFKDVVVKMCPEISDIVTIGYREQSMYNPTDFTPVYKYLVGIDLYFDNYNGMKKSKNEYGKEIGDYFRMTYGSEMEFVSFHVQSFIFPPERTNKDKFFELFGKE
jgi:hypothetical protein